MQSKGMKPINVSLDKTTSVVCEKCGGKSFQGGILLRKVSRFITGDVQDGIIPIETFYCASCGHVNEEFLPKNQS
jgi:ribosomal protein L37E